jgi:hypothetical protein
MTGTVWDLSPAQVHAASSCPDCKAVRPHMCRNEAGATLAHPHRNRRLLAYAIEVDRVRESIGFRLHLRADQEFRRRTAWDAGRQWDREEAERLRLWLRCYGSVLWDPPRTTGGTL